MPEPPYHYQDEDTAPCLAQLADDISRGRLQWIQPNRAVEGVSWRRGQHFLMCHWYPLLNFMEGEGEGTKP